jgi:GTP-sensing pleiotropic transcriptional regulator CodY
MGVDLEATVAYSAWQIHVSDVVTVNKTIIDNKGDVHGTDTVPAD